MIITFGIDTLPLTDPSQVCCECDACGKRTQFVELQARWFHVATLPILPFGLHGQMQCLGCGAAPTPTQMSAEALAYYKGQRRAAWRRGGWAIPLGWLLFFVGGGLLLLHFKTQG